MIREFVDYSPAFGSLKGRFVTVGEASREAAKAEVLAAINLVVRLLEREVSENLIYDHWHPEMAGPLQQALYFLQLVREGAREAAQGVKVVHFPSVRIVR